jgi:hypothetical protein
MIYIVQDGDKADAVARMGAVQMPSTIGFCELCGCYRASRIWHTMRWRGTPYYACQRHTPMEHALWETEATL